MLKFLNWLLTWWNGYTIGTWLFTKRHGCLVGEDIFGNAYYQPADGKRRWVLYKNVAEASLVPAEWHGWPHHTVDAPPTVEPPKVKHWERKNRPNLTGTPLAQKPVGSLASAGQRPHATRDYEAWKPK